LDGLHIVANLYRCRGDARYLTDAAPLRQFCLERIDAAGLTVLGELFHQFPGADSATGGGVTGCVVLAESHLALHTWPELGAVTLDVYVCNFTCNNDAKAHQLVADLKALFQPEDYVSHDVPRDRQHLYESLNDDHGFFVRSARRLEDRPTRYQALEVHESPQFGRLLRLDGCFMTSEKDEFYYHENLVHPAATAHPNPRKALIIGGGDGGAAEELLKHPSIDSVTLVELDGEVVDVARKWFGAIHHGVFDHRKLRVLIDDGMKFLAGTTEKFDLIALDLPDPIGPAAALYEEPFFRDCRKALAPGGVLTLHMGSPVAKPEQVQAHAERLARVFPVVRPFVMFIPLYGSLWSMACCSDTLDVTAVGTEEIDRRIAKRRIADLQYYNGATHRAVFALPNFVRRLTVATERAPLVTARTASGS
jgi:spermidine synthase